jgi:hypothetical protein
MRQTADEGEAGSGDQEHLLSIIVGTGLAASCGFRVFIPLLVASAAVKAGYLNPGGDFAWIGTWPAIAAFGIATLMEVAAYYVPWLDNLLDTIASPTAVVAGTVLFATSVTEFDPFLKWSLAVIAGGGSAGVVQGATVAARVASTTTTGGIANSVLNTLETLAGFFFSVGAILVPVVAFVLLLAVVGSLYYLGRRVVRKFFSPRIKTDH